MKITKVALYGGAFNPIHKGHVQVAHWVLNETNLFDEVWLLPCYKHIYAKEMVSTQDRLEMCRLAVQDEKGITVCDYEIKNKMQGSTYELIQRLQSDPEFLNIKFSLIIGEDNAKSFHKWKQSEKLIAECNVVVIPRKGEPLVQNDVWYKKPPHLYLKEADNIPGCSSTEIRKALMNGNFEIVKQDLCIQVIDYIRINKLYMTTLKE